MRVAVASTGRTKSLASAFPLLLLSVAIVISTGCGTSGTKTMQTTSAPPQPNYPSIPPEPITWPISNPASTTLPAPTAEDESTAPWKDGSNDFPLLVASPLTSTTVTSPVHVVANASPTNAMFFIRVYVDQLAVYYTANNSLDTQIFVGPGPHTLTVMAEDQKGYISATPLQITVSAQAPDTNGQTLISDIQTLSGWQSCGGLFPSDSQRAGQICAAGGGTPSSTMTPNISSPAMDGKSAQFTMGPASPDCPHYCNMLYFNPVAGGNNVSHFVYDLYFYIDNPNAPQALEFDLNQGYGGSRWVWGSECNFKDSGKWDIWDGIEGWKPTQFPCKASDFPANTWIHLVWNVERVGNQVHYISLTVGNNVYNVDTYYSYQPVWTLEEIDNAFQMDLDAVGTPYNVWLDKVNLTTY